MILGEYFDQLIKHFWRYSEIVDIEGWVFKFQFRHQAVEMATGQPSANIKPRTHPTSPFPWLPPDSSLLYYLNYLVIVVMNDHLQMKILLYDNQITFVGIYGESHVDWPTAHSRKKGGLKMYPILYHFIFYGVYRA